MAETSTSALRLISLLGKVRGGLRQFWDSFRSTLASGRTDFPSLWTESAGCIVSPHTTSDSSDIETAAAYLCDMGLKHDAGRLSTAWKQWETLYADVLREIDEYGEEFRKVVVLCCRELPDPNDATAVNKQVVLVRHVTLLLGLLDELIATVEKQVPSQALPASDGAEDSKQGEGNGIVISPPDAKPEGSEGNGGAAPLNEESPPREVAEFIFAPEGDGYYIAGLGQRGHFRGIKGFAIVARLIRTPGQSVQMTELVGAGDDQRVANDHRSKQENLDESAMKAIRERLTELRQDVEKARNKNSTVEMDLAQHEINELEPQLRRDIGLAGRPRDMNSATEKLRPRIHGNLQTAWTTLRKATPPATELADHFEAAISSEGGAFIYRPAIPVNWSFLMPMKK